MDSSTTTTSSTWSQPSPVWSLTSLSWPQSSQTSSTSSLPSLLVSTSTSMVSINHLKLVQHLLYLLYWSQPPPPWSPSTSTWFFSSANRGHLGDQCGSQARTKVRSGAHTQRRHDGHRLTNVIFAIRLMIQLMSLTYI